MYYALIKDNDDNDRQERWFPLRANSWGDAESEVEGYILDMYVGEDRDRHDDPYTFYIQSVRIVHVMGEKEIDVGSVIDAEMQRHKRRVEAAKEKEDRALYEKLKKKYETK
jgi:hypothetical protein